MAGQPVEDPTLIGTSEGLGELVAHIRQAGRFAFDTEFVSEDTYEPILCLIQVATKSRLAVVDPLQIEDLSPFWDVVLDPSIEVVMHAAGEDLRICRIQAGRIPERLFDVQIAAGLVGFGYPLSLSNLVHQALKVSLMGGETRTDWRRRPLSDAQLRYALEDVRHLLELAEMLEAELHRRGRTEWAEAEFNSFLHAIDHRSDVDRWRRLSGLHTLNRRGLEVARRLSEWRSKDAKRINRPLRSVLRDDLLVAISKRQPNTRRDLEALRDFNRPQLLARSGEILRVIAEAQTTPIEDLPEPAERHDDGPGLAMVISLLSATLSQSCAEAKVAVGLAGGANDLKVLVRWYLDGMNGDRSISLLEGWREGVCGRTLLEVLSGKRALRIVEPGAEVPVVIDPISG
ncbi:ribonuclease D [Tundrisphaera lichenicola]|uniref:ribonuclease D n=1 Tax=Tundrisphaera lichenicola TaxID=2029860 RepID=UPI003EB96AE0